MTQVDSERGALRGAVRELLEDLCSEDHVRTAIGDHGGVDDALCNRIAEMGVLELAAPSFRDQEGASLLDLLVVFEELGRFLAPIPALSTAVTICALDAAEAKQLRWWARDIASGQRRVAVAVTVAEDMVTPRSRASASGPDGAPTVTARLPAVPDAVGADALLVLALHDEGTGLFLVPTSGTGVSVTAVQPFDLTRPAADVVLEDAEAHLIADEGSGRVAPVLWLAWLLLSAEQVGVAQRALDAVVSYAKIRTQFGRAIGSFQAVKHSCVDMLVQVQGSRELVRAAAVALDAGASHEAFLQVNLAAAYASEAAIDCAQRSLQIYGGIGFTWDHGAHLALRKARADSVRLGHASAHWQAVTGELTRRGLAAAGRPVPGEQVSR
jgi:alkylation response protein AidB-like acyl-CoA dehydrogenase